MACINESLAMWHFKTQYWDQNALWNSFYFLSRFATL